MVAQSAKIYSISASYSLTSDFQSASIETRYLSWGSLQFNWVDIDAFNARVILQGSNDNTSWNDFGGEGGGIITLLDTDTQIWEFTKFTTRYIRLDFTANNVTSGSASLYFEGHRV